VATALLVAGSTLTFWISWQTLLHPPARTQASFKVLGCLYNCRQPTYASFQLKHVTWWPRCSTDQVRASCGGQNEDKTLLQRSQRRHKGEFRHGSISARQWSLRCELNLRGPFLRATLQMTVGRAMAINGKTKALRTPPTRWVSAQLLYVRVTAW